MPTEKEYHTVRGYQLISKNTLTSAMEDYLEMIYKHILEKGYCRINNLSKELNVMPSSATKMVQKLSEMGLLAYKRYGIILPTEMGNRVGNILLKRHVIIEEFLSNIGLNDNILTETELIEHNIGNETLENIQMFNEFLSENPDIMTKFEEFKNTEK